MSGSRKGIPNKATNSIRERVTLLFTRYTADLMWKDLEEVSAKDRLLVFANLAEFIAPKLQRSEVDQNTNSTITYEVIYVNEPHQVPDTPPVASLGPAEGNGTPQEI